MDSSRKNFDKMVEIQEGASKAVGKKLFDIANNEGN